jgi:FkbM family methyltransferase
LRYRIFPDMGLSPIYGGWEEEAQQLMLEHIRPGSVVYDVGANYGIHTLLMAKTAQPHGHVYAFEPLPEIFTALEENISLNNFSNVTCVCAAIDDQTGQTTFVKGDHVGAGHLGSISDASGEKTTVTTITMDEFVFEQHQRPPDFIKMDIEGAEGKALAGGERVLQKYRPILLVDLHNPEQDLAVGKILLRCGYEAVHADTMLKVKDLSKGWPEPDGLWGQFIAFPRD